MKVVFSGGAFAQVVGISLQFSESPLKILERSTGNMGQRCRVPFATDIAVRASDPGAAGSSPAGPAIII